MTPDVMGVLALAFTMLVALMGWIWYAATWKAGHEHRIKTLEENDGELSVAIKDLTRAVNKLDKHLAVSDARASQGQYADSDSPPKG